MAAMVKLYCLPGNSEAVVWQNNEPIEFQINNSPYVAQSRRDGRIIDPDVQHTKSRRDDTGFTGHDTPSGLAFPDLPNL